MHLKPHRWSVIIAYAITDIAAETGGDVNPVDLTVAPSSATSIMCYDCGVTAPPSDPHCPEAPRAGYPE